MKLNPYDIECISLARDLLLKNIRQNRTIANLAQEAGINENKLKKGFKLLFGSSVHAFLVQARLEKALLLLEETDKSVKEIGMMTGYKRLSSFTKAFKKVYGLSPLFWRKERKNIPMAIPAAIQNIQLLQKNYDSE